MTSRVTGFSVFYLVHGVHPVLPFDLVQATFMMEGFRSNDFRRVISIKNKTAGKVSRGLS
jgi:hypothetical protein